MPKQIKFQPPHHHDYVCNCNYFICAFLECRYLFQRDVYDAKNPVYICVHVVMKPIAPRNVKQNIGKFTVIIAFPCRRFTFYLPQSDWLIIYHLSISIFQNSYPLRIALNKAARMQEAIADQKRNTWRVTTAAQIKSHIIIPSGTLVVISYVLNQKFVFVRPSTGDNNADYVQTLQEILIFAETAEPIQQAPKCGQILLALHQNNYYRVFISHVYDSGFAIVAKLDFGDLVQLPVSQLFALSVELQTRQIFVRKIKLCETESKSVHQINYLLELKETEQQLTLKYEGEWSPGIDCNLFIADTNESINEKLAQLQGVSSPLQEMVDYIHSDSAAKAAEVVEVFSIEQIFRM